MEWETEEWGTGNKERITENRELIMETRNRERKTVLYRLVLKNPHFRDSRSQRIPVPRFCFYFSFPFPFPLP